MSNELYNARIEMDLSESYIVFKATIEGKVIEFTITNPNVTGTDYSYDGTYETFNSIAEAGTLLEAVSKIFGDSVRETLKSHPEHIVRMLKDNLC